MAKCLAALCLACCALLVAGRPDSGHYKQEATLAGDTSETVICKRFGFYNESEVSIEGWTHAEKDINVDISVTIYKAKCANSECNEDIARDPTMQPVATNVMTVKASAGPFIVSVNNTHYKPVEPPEVEAPGVDAPSNNGTPPATTNMPTTVPATGHAATTNTNKTSTTNTTSAPIGVNSKRAAATDSSKPNFVWIPTTQPMASINTGNGVYFVAVKFLRTDDKNKDSNVTISVEMRLKNSFGYLSAVDYPALVFYGVMTAVYVIYALTWIVLMLISYKDLVRLQFWIFAVIILGFAEKVFFVSEYSSVNQGFESGFIIMLAEVISAGKRALSRMLLVIVSLGFGTVKPRLGDSLGRVLLMGLCYFIFAAFDGITRARTETYLVGETLPIVTMLLLLAVDAAIIYWVFVSIVATRRALRLRKNFVKMSLYNHFAYTLIFGILCTIGFILWVAIVITFPKDGCLRDWSEAWVKDCFWHMLFAFLLLSIMIIWRPSGNKARFTYSLVDNEEEEEVEQGANKNFDTVKMRTTVKSESEAPPISSQAEDDLRWVEENLPTTALDKALPLLLDSEDEVMTTKFEVSKMN